MAPTNWHSPAEMAKEAAIYAAFVLVLAGIASWDVLSTLPFDFSILSGRRKWRWPMLLYFIDRFAMLLHIYAYSVNLNAISYIDCDTVVWMCKITDMLGTITSSAILALRTTAVWNQKKRVTVPLAIASAVQIILWGQTMRYSKSIWNPQREVCQIIQTSPVPLLIAVWSYTMTYDFIILCLCAFKLWKARTHGGIGALLLRDGIAYFAATFASNLVQVTIAAQNLNPVMNIIAVPFTLVTSVIAATTVFRHVFVMYDDFSAGDTTRGASKDGVATVGGSGPRSRGLGFSMSKTRQNDTFALASIRSNPTAAMAGIEVHKVVDVDREALSYGQPNRIRTTDDDDSSWTEEKK